MDLVGNAFVTGTTQSTDFPMTTTIGSTEAPGYDKTNDTPSDQIFLVKLNPAGTELIYATYYSSTSSCQVSSIGIDSQGCAYLVGSAGDDLPMTTTIGGSAAPGYDQTPGGSFVVKFNPEGTELLYATRLKGTGIYDIFIDSLGYAYVTGMVISDTLPITNTVGGSSIPGYDQTYHGGGSTFTGDAFAIKLNQAGTELVYSTYLGGSANYDKGGTIHGDAFGNVYIGGITRSNDFPMTKTVGGEIAPGYDKSFNPIDSSDDSFIVKLNPTGTELIYATFLGGDSDNRVTSVDIDSSGCLYIVGYTKSKNFPMTKTVGGEIAPGYDKNYFNSPLRYMQGFAVKFNPEGTELLYSTYLGSENAFANSIKLDPSGNAWIMGGCLGNIPMTKTLNGAEFAPGYDQLVHANYTSFIYQLNTEGTELRYASYFGGSVQENTRFPRIIDLDSQGNVYAALYTFSSDFPMTTEVGGPLAPGYDKNFHGEFDAVTFKIGNPNPSFIVTASVTAGIGTVSPTNQEILPGENATINITPAAGYQIASITDNGQSKTITTPYVINNVTENHTVEITFEIAETAYPNLKIWAESNKPTFNENDTAMFLVTIANQGNGVATATKVTLTLPPELGFLKATRYRAIKQTSRIIEFEVGVLAGNSIHTFQVDVSVDANVAYPRSLITLFDITCAEKSNDSTHVMILLEPKKTGDSNLYLGLYYRNALWDPVNSTAYILMNTPLELDFILSGAQLPYKLTIDWGDGVIDRFTNQNEARQTLKHQFTSKGKVTMKFEVHDNRGQAKSATVYIDIR